MPQKKSLRTLTSADREVIRREVQRNYWKQAMDGISRFWGDGPPKPRTARPSVRKTRRPTQLPSLHYDRIEAFAVWYWGLVDRAAGHLAWLLAQAYAFRGGLANERITSIKNETEEYVQRKLSVTAVRGWFAFTISDPISAPKLPGFENELSRVMAALRKLSLPMEEAEQRLGVAVALWGSSQPVFTRLVDAPVLTLEDLMRKKSVNYPEAARALGVSARTIYNWLKQGRLNKTGHGRVACDETMGGLYKLRHEATEK